MIDIIVCEHGNQIKSRKTIHDVNIAHFLHRKHRSDYYKLGSNLQGNKMVDILVREHHSNEEKNTRSKHIAHLVHAENGC